MMSSLVFMFMSLFGIVNATSEYVESQQLAPVAGYSDGDVVTGTFYVSYRPNAGEEAEDFYIDTIVVTDYFDNDITSECDVTFSGSDVIFAGLPSACNEWSMEFYNDPSQPNGGGNVVTITTVDGTVLVRELDNA